MIAMSAQTSLGRQSGNEEIGSHISFDQFRHAYKADRFYGQNTRKNRFQYLFKRLWRTRCKKHTVDFMRTSGL